LKTQVLKSVSLFTRYSGLRLLKVQSANTVTELHWTNL